MFRMARLLVLALAMVAAAAACSRAADETEAKKWADHPPADMPPPANLSIAVTVDGTPQPAITAATLTAHKPDFADSDRSAWMISTLVPAAKRPGTIVEASSPTGITVKFERASAGLEPVVYLTRRGDIVVAALDPKDPFPRYHGQGARLHRPGDTSPRVNPVASIAITYRR